MISAGKNIKQRNDKLYKIEISHLYKSLKNPKREIKEMIEQLRLLQVIDPKAYRQRKTMLPYVVPSLFSPAVRRKENFVSISHLILDIDHINDYELDIKSVKLKLQKDSRIELMFVSPSGNGLKIFFRLKNKCLDAQKFSVFYSAFARSFAKEYNLLEVVDFVTSDVTRACFVSYDVDAFFNESSEPVDMQNYIDFDDIITVRKIEKSNRKIEKENKKEFDKNLSKNEFDEIRKLLKPELSAKIEKKKHIFVPQELEQIIDDIKNSLVEHKIVVDEVRNIHYGKKICFSYQHHKAELNVFYGKKVFR